MAIAVKMPDLGVTIEAVVLLKWHKQEGDHVERGEPLCEVETDKAATDLEAVAGGVLLKQVARVGAEIPVGAVVAYIGAPGESVPE